MDITSRQPEDPGYFQDAVSLQGPKDPMESWLSRNDRPWTGLHDGGLEIQPSQAMESRGAYDPFSDYRSTGIRSECDTVPGDSAYGSCVPPSIENASVYGDEPFPQTQEMEQEFSSFHLNLPNSLMEPAYSTPKAQGMPSKAIQSSEGGLRCECGSLVKTRAELKKHTLRHNKPFICPNRDCDRHTNGFASQNDLTRHQMGVHKKHDLGKTYVCRHDPCDKKDAKLWPRADNFRSHLSRVHNIQFQAEDDISFYLYSSKPNQPIADVLSGVGTNLQDQLGPSGGQDVLPGHQLANESMGDFPEIPATDPSAPHVLSASYRPFYDDKLLMPPPPPSDNGSRFIRPTDLGGSPFVEGVPTSRSDPEAYGQQQAAQGSPKPGTPAKREPVLLEMSCRQSAAYQDASDVETEPDLSVTDETDSDTKEPHSSDVPLTIFKHESPHVPPLNMDLDQPHVMEYLKKLPRHLLEQALAGTTEDEEHEDTKSAPGLQTTQNCSSCHKTFNRRCELRKHMKRHERPYGCTVFGCDKKFGSKNDWKRHENGQHNQSDIWECEGGCDQFFYRREDLEDHLRSSHNMVDEATIQKKLENNRRGSHCRNSFWCGFCQELVPVKRDANAIDQRFDHIDNHFMGRNVFPKQNIESWQHLEEYQNRPRRGGETGRKRKFRTGPADGRPSKQPHKMSA